MLTVSGHVIVIFKPYFLVDVMEGKQTEVLGTFSVPLEGRFECLRRGETNLGNWICDVLLAATGADLVLLNSGTFRSDRVHPAGPFTLGDMVNVVPMSDPIIVLNVSGNLHTFYILNHFFIPVELNKYVMLACLSF